MKLLEQNSNYSATNLSELLGKSKKTIERNFLSLQEKGYLVRVGSKKLGHWKVVK